MRSPMTRPRARALARPALMLAALSVLPVLAVATQPALAAADTARIVPEEPTRSSIVITDDAGGQRTLGPFAVASEPVGLSRSPDGRSFAVLTGGLGDFVAGITIVPADGSEPFSFPLASRIGRFATLTTTRQVSWSLDGRDLIAGWVSHAGKSDGAVLRCQIEARSCAAVPGVQGLAAPVPGGIITASVHGPLDLLIMPMNDTDDWLTERQLRGLRKLRRERIVLVTEASTRTLVERRRNALDGLQDTVEIVGGPSGALIAQRRFRVGVVRRGKRQVARPDSARQSWTLVTPSGTRRTVVAPRLTVPKGHGSSNGGVSRIRAQRAVVNPAAPRSAGGWLGTTGYAIAHGTTDSGLVLTRITRTGAARFVRTGEGLASAATLARPLADGRLEPGSASLSVIGHEAKTDAAIVLVAWAERGSSMSGRLATVRVPLDERTAPTVVSREWERAAW